MKNIYLLCTSLAVLFISCEPSKSLITAESQNNSIKSLTFIDEVIIPSDEMYNGTAVGGLSGIDYAQGNWFVICDNRTHPRYYTMNMSVSSTQLGQPMITNMASFLDPTGSLIESGTADPESLRVTTDAHIIWSSEGNIKNSIHPFIRISQVDGSFISDIRLPNRYLVQEEDGKGPRNNGVFEALSLDHTASGYWVATELPLEEDGLAPTFDAVDSPLRIAYIDSENETFGKEYVYELEKVARKGKPVRSRSIEVNGVTEILSYDTNKFLVLERSYASGYEDGGNDIKVYLVDISSATDVSGIESLASSTYVAATKTLLLDFSSIRSELTSGIVDNIEGMTFGPDLENGHKSLVFISDNNFNAFGSQLTQIILFEVNE